MAADRRLAAKPVTFNFNPYIRLGVGDGAAVQLSDGLDRLYKALADWGSRHHSESKFGG